ncbi:hypothetical protein [Methyloceanibacter sp.]|uniref:hypothetical protein n=1 Tax=Methyloceanibacter sp. TaxID=1965321 RepID=UPI002D412811|nr:hypothetical protein [Methyloceanibacter sp.]HZP09211.1 hypothetical protein [Methyloceanibacter sp.]
MKLLRLVTGALGAAGLVLLFAAGTARADCNPDTAIYDDDFEFLDGSWGDPDDHFDVEEGALTVHDWREQVNFATKNQGANICVDTTIADAPGPDASPMGVIFWWQDWDNYYYAWYWADGSVAVNRILKGKYVSVVSTKSLAVKTGVGQTNHLELDVRAKDATLFINGTQVTRFRGVQPKDGGVVGIIAYSADNKPGIYKWDNFIVSEPGDTAGGPSETPSGQ